MLELETNKIYQGHVLDVLKTFPDNYFYYIGCSPPYWGLRDYGLEPQTWKTNKWYSCDEWNTHHDFNIIEKEIKSNKNENFNERYGNSPGKSKQEESQQIHLKSGFCRKCQAWKGSLGLEPDFNMYIDHLIQIFDECKRVLRKDGSLWVNLGDTYYGGGNASGHTDQSENFGISTLKRGMVTKPVAKGNQLQNKTLVGIPDRFKIAMIDKGWICRNEIIWHKPNCMPSSVKDRFTNDFEKFFFFVKSRKYYFEQQFEPIDMDSLRPSKVGKNNPKGGNRQGLDDWTKKNSAKYSDLYEESKHRQGMNKSRGEKMVKKRNLPDQGEFVDYMRSIAWLPDVRDGIKYPYVSSNKLKIKWIWEDLGLEKSKVEHWFRYDESGFSFPSIEDWLKFQEIYNTDKFSELVEFWEEPDSIKSYSQNLDQAFLGNSPTNYYRMGENLELGRNKRTTWSINTRPFPDAHFAVFPEELIETPIKACCPEEICIECDKPRELIIKTEGGTGKSWHNHENDLIDGQSKSNAMPQEHKKTISRRSSCDCNAGFRPGVVLDIFMGAGTTGVVAKKQKKKWVGIELNPEYIEMAIKRIKKVAIYDTLEVWF